jgi:hypothetical protein
VKQKARFWKANLQKGSTGLQGATQAHLVSQREAAKHWQGKLQNHNQTLLAQWQR